MKFTPAPLAGAFVVDIEANEDGRGLFARTWCEREFAEHGLDSRMVQASLSRNRRRGTLRGMHLQLPPSREAKLVRCTRGSIFDVIVDLRPDSATFGAHFGVELSAETGRALYIPPLMAHGFQTLEDECDVAYQMTDHYAPGLGYGLRWDDPALGIDWPIRDGVILLDRDRDCPDFDPAAYRRLLHQMP
ncbi:MAG: dTDP-4-dehydrorhamnose 3,5-epimerase [Comamonadaceae bacterium]|nr:MAG: dTDP-4-dehydrorhamnose 3,5-epimerase [Comamonadaceae bacterium]